MISDETEGLTIVVDGLVGIKLYESNQAIFMS